MASHGYEAHDALGSAAPLGNNPTWMSAPVPASGAPATPPMPPAAWTSSGPVPPPVQWPAQPAAPGVPTAPSPRPYSFPEPSTNVAALLHSRETHPAAPMPSEAPTVAMPMGWNAQDAAPTAPFAAASMQQPAGRPSRASVSDDTASSNVTALLRSQAPIFAASRGSAAYPPPRPAVPQPVYEDDTMYDDEQYEDYDESTSVLDDDVQDAPPPTKPPKVKRKRRVSDILLLVLAILLIAGGATYGIMTVMQTSTEGTLTDIVGNHVIPDDPSMLDPTTVAQMDATADTGQHFIIDSVGLDVPLGEVNEVGGVMNPPGFTSAYLVRNRGVSLANATKGTVYVVAHSLRAPGVAPGNYVIDVAAGKVAVAVGATIQVGDRTYTMTASEVVDKKLLGGDSKLWANTPGMLVFITCLQYNDASKYANTAGHSPTNAVIIGKLVS